MGMHGFCAQALKQVTNSEIYLAISSFFWQQWMKKNWRRPNLDWEGWGTGNRE